MNYIEASLLNAVKKGNLKLADEYIKMGASVDMVDYDYHTLLDIAVLHENVEMCELLVKNNVNPNRTNCYGDSALHYAAKFNKADICAKKLVELGANVNILNRDKQTPLHVAVSEQNLKFVEALIHAKARIDALDKDNRSPLYIGVKNNVTLDIIDILVKNGAEFRFDCKHTFSVYDLIISPYVISEGDIRKYFDNCIKEENNKGQIKASSKINKSNPNSGSEDVSSPEK